MSKILRLPWLLLALVFAACGGGADPTATRIPAAPTATTAPAAPVVAAATATPRVLVTPTTAPLEAETPRYGGILDIGDGYGRTATGNLLGLVAKTGIQIDSGARNGLYNNLFIFDIYHEREFRGVLAKSWSYSDDKTVLTIGLEPGVKFHDGTPMTARDVVYTLSTAISPPEGYFTQHSGYMDGVFDTATATDDLTVVLQQKRASVEFLERLTNANLKVLPSHVSLEIVNATGLGTGPFRFKKEAFRRDIVVEFERNPFYWRKDDAGMPLPYMDGIRNFNFQDFQQGSAALRTGQVKWVNNGQSPIVDHQADILLKEGALLDNRLAAGFGILYKNKPPFDDPRVRRAIDLWLNRKEIVDISSGGAYANKPAFTSGGSFYTAGMVPIEQGGKFGLPVKEIMNRPGYRQVNATGKVVDTLAELDTSEELFELRKYKVDQDAAKALLEEAGIKQGSLGIPMVPAAYEISRSGPPITAQMTKLFGKTWPMKDLGKGVAQEIAKGKFDTYIHGWGILEFVSAALGTWYRKDRQGPRVAGWPADDPFQIEFDRLAALQDNTFDPIKRRAMIQDIQRVLLDWNIRTVTYTRQGGGAYWPVVRNAPDTNFAGDNYQFDIMWLDTATRTAP